MRHLLLVAASLALIAILADRISLVPSSESPSSESPSSESPSSRSGTGIASPSGDIEQLAGEPGRVVDRANVLGNYLAALEWQTDSWHGDLGIDFHVVTVADSGRSVSDLAATLLTARNVGREAPTGGLLLLLDPVRREAHIEVSYALEGALPDALIGRLAEDQLAPYAASAAIGMAVADTLHLLKDVLILQVAKGQFEIDPAYRGRASFAAREKFLSGGAGAHVVIPDAQTLAGRNLKARVPDAERGRYAPSTQPIGSVERFLAVARDLAGDPTLPLFTPGSQCMKAYYPFAPYEQIERAARLDASRPWQVEQQGDRAVVRSAVPVQGAVPVLLHRIDGTWRIDEVETWKNLFYDERGEYNLKNRNMPYAFGFPAARSVRSLDVAAHPLGGAHPQRVVDALVESGGALERFLAGDILFRNCFLPDPAIALYEQAIAASEAPMFLETLADRAAYVGFRQAAIRAYRKLGRQAYAKLAWQEQAAGRGDVAEAVARRAVEQNPFDLISLATLQRALEVAGKASEAAVAAREVDRARRDPLRRHLGVELKVSPEAPRYDIGEPTRVGRTLVYDHAYFEVRLTNRSRRPVTVTRLRLGTAGTDSRSGLGDIRHYFDWSASGGPNRLGPGASAAVERTWGFTVDTAHDQLSYVFDLCWQGDGDPVQCRVERLDLIAPPALRLASDGS